MSEPLPVNEREPCRFALFRDPYITAAVADVYGLARVDLALPGKGGTLTAYRVQRPGTSRLMLAPFNFQPVLRDSNVEIARALVGAAAATSPRTTLRLKLHHPLPHDLVSELGLACAVDGVETLIPIDGTPTGWLERMRPRHRTKLRAVRQKAAEAGIIIKPFRDLETLRGFYEVLVEAYRTKHRMLPQPFGLFKRLIGFDNGPQGVKGYAAVNSATGRIEGGILVMCDEVQWCYAWGANRAETSGLELGTLLIGKALEDAVSAGARVFSLGLSALGQSDLRRYKRGWGGEEHEVMTYYWRETPAPVDLQSDFALARTIITRMPNSLLGPLSSVAVKWLV